jgi:circadian clock protein KaiC
VDGRGLSLGEPLRNFQGVLRGIPELIGDQAELLGRRPA